MKKLIILLLAITIWALFFAPWIVYKSVPYKWQLQSEVIKDSSFHTGEYVKVNDSIRIIILLAGNYNLERYTVQEKVNDIWINVVEDWYTSILNRNPRFLIYLTLQSKYEETKKFKGNKL